MGWCELYSWLLSQPQVGSKKVQKLHCFWSNQGVVEANVICSMSKWKHRSLVKSVLRKILPPHVAKLLLYNNIIKLTDQFKKDLLKQNIYTISWLDTDYPTSLQILEDKPAVLFWRSKLFKDASSLTKKLDKAIGIVGTRRLSKYGHLITTQITTELMKHPITTISGLAVGIDTIVHEITMKFNGLTIAIVAGGMNGGFPRRNFQLHQRIIEKGVVISEFPPGREDLNHRGMFPMRNRIIAGLSRVIIVTEAPLKSGSILTAKLAQSYSRDVFVVPSDIDRATNAGSLQLMKSGGVGIISSGNDVISTLGW